MYDMPYAVCMQPGIYKLFNHKMWIMFFYVVTVIIIVIFLNDNTNRVIGSNFDGNCIINRDYNNRK